MGVVDGLLKMSNVSPEGKLATFAGMPAGAWFGEGTVLKNECRKYDVIALRDSRIACRPRATFTWLLDRSIAFDRFLLDHLNERLGQFIAMVEYDRLLDPMPASRAASDRWRIRSRTRPRAMRCASDRRRSAIWPACRASA